MHLLLDENMCRIEDDLTGQGVPADHIDPLRLKGISDGRVFEVALALNHDAVVTKDRFRQRPARLASLQAMTAGLRIVRLIFNSSGPVLDSDEAELRLILAHRKEIEAAVAPNSPIRLLVLNANMDRVTRTQHLDEVADELRTLEERIAARRR